MSGTDVPEGKSSRKKGYTPDDDKDYRLSRINLEEAENGIVIECSYDLKDEAKTKMRASEQQGLYCGSTYCEPERHVFTDQAEAKAFIVSELDSLWADNVEE